MLTHNYLFQWRNHQNQPKHPEIDRHSGTLYNCWQPIGPENPLRCLDFCINRTNVCLPLPIYGKSRHLGRCLGPIQVRLVVNNRTKYPDDGLFRDDYWNLAEWFRQTFALFMQNPGTSEVARVCFNNRTKYPDDGLFHNGCQLLIQF